MDRDEFAAWSDLHHRKRKSLNKEMAAARNATQRAAVKAKFDAHAEEWWVEFRKTMLQAYGHEYWAAERERIRRAYAITAKQLGLPDDTQDTQT